MSFSPTSANAQVVHNLNNDIVSALKDDDIYSLERLRPAPPKPPKPESAKIISSSSNKTSVDQVRPGKPKQGSTNLVSGSPLTTPVEVSSSPRTLPSLESSSTASLLPQSSSLSSTSTATLTITSQPLLLERSFSLQETTTSSIVSKKLATTRLQSNPITESENRLATLLERDSFGPRALNGSTTVSSSIEMAGLISATSSSLLHGIILLLIMLISLVAFVASKLADPCEDFYLSDNLECSTLTAIGFSAVNILSCLYSFTIYFLHLIGQCDYISWSARRKVALEIVCTLGMISALIGSIVALYTKTIALSNAICLTASVFSMVTIFLYLLRIGLLVREIRMLWSKPLPSRQPSTSSRKMSVIGNHGHNQDQGPSAAGKLAHERSKKWSSSRGSFSRASVTSAGHHQQTQQQSVSHSGSVKYNQRENNQTINNTLPEGQTNAVAQEHETELEDDVFIS